MNGIESIKKRILDKNHAECTGILEKAKQEADSIAAKQKAESDTQTEEIVQKAIKKAEQLLHVSETAAHMTVKRELLIAKRKIIDSVFDIALEKLCNLDKEQYEKLLIDLILSCKTNSDDVLKLSNNTCKCLGLNIGDTLNKALADAGKAVVILGEPTDEFKGGFVLESKSSRQICSFEGLIEAKRDELEAKVAEVLF